MQILNRRSIALPQFVISARRIGRGCSFWRMLWYVLLVSCCYLSAGAAWPIKALNSLRASLPTQTFDLSQEELKQTISHRADSHSRLKLASTSSPQQSDLIPASFFGLTVLDFQNLAPDLTYGTTRTWDSYPNLDWADVNPAPGIYDFAYLDAFLGKNQGREVIYTLGRTPRWASGLPDKTGAYGPGQCAAPANLQWWDDYLSALAKHFRGRIRYWELGNEVNDPRFYCSDVKTMVLMAERAHAVLKSIDPHTQILSPSVTGGTGPEWLDRFLSQGGGQYVDAIAFHGYWSTSAEDILPLVQRYRKVLSAHGIADKPLWDTEASWADFGMHPLQGSDARAAFLAKYYLLEWSVGIRSLVWYAYDGGETWGGLWDKKAGVHADARAYAQVYDWMVGAVMTNPCRPTGLNLWTCSLQKPGSAPDCVAWTTSGLVRFALPTSATGVVGVEGQAQSVHDKTLLINTSPVLIRGTDCP